MNTFQLIVEADTNDADYITEISEFDPSEENLSRLAKVCKVITDNGGDWHTGEQGEFTDDYINEINDGDVSVEDLEWFDNFVPYGEYGTHTVESVTLQEIVRTTNFL